MSKVKRFLSTMLVFMLMPISYSPSVFGAEQIDKSVSHSFDTDTSVPKLFSMVGKGGSLKLENGALKVTTNVGATESIKIDLSDWEGASRKKGILTYSFDYKAEIPEVTTSIMVGSNSTARGHLLAGLQQTRMLGYDGGASQKVIDWLAVKETGDTYRVTLQFDFSQKTYTCSMAGQTITHPFDYFEDKTVVDEPTYTCEGADKFVLYFRTYHKDAYNYCIDNFEAEYTERYIQENIEKSENFIKIINDNGTAEEFKEALIAVASVAAAYGYDNADLVAGDSIKAIGELQKVLYEGVPYAVDADTSIPVIMEKIKINMPMISINSASSAEEIKYSLSTYYNEYSVDLSFVENYTEAEKTYFYNNIVSNRNDKGEFVSNADIAEAITDAKFKADSSAALEKYNKAHALTLPKVFEEFKNILEVDMSYIPNEYTNQTLFILKTMTVASYSDIPDALKEAYEKAKGEKEVFEDVYEYDTKENMYEIKPGIERVPTVIPVEDYFTDMADFGWAKEAVEHLYSRGIISGKGDRIYAPDHKVTREEFVKMIVCSFDIKASGDVKEFTDVDKDEWYAPYINAACSSGIIQGHNDGSFGVGESIIREDVATILYRTANVKDIKLETYIGEKFNDVDAISSYAQSSVGVLRTNGIINGVGDNMFEPKLNTNRAEAAVMIYKLLTFGG